MTTKDHHPQIISIILNSKMNSKNCEWEITSERENFWDVPFFNFCSKIISRDNVIQKAINCQFCFILFFSPSRRDPHCKRLQTNKKATQHEVISQQRQPRIIIRRKYPPSWTPRWTYKIANEKLQASAITSELFHFSNFWVKKISRDNAIQKEKHCQFSEIIHFYNFCLKNISRDNTIQKAITCQFWLMFFFSPTRRDPQCNRMQTNKKATQHEVISQQRQPRIIIRR